MTATPTEKTPLSKLIHVASFTIEGRNRYLFLRKTSGVHYTWFEELEHGKEKETAISAPSIEESMRLAARHWKPQFFRTVICGFRYTLPERDEHGINALFHQMAASLTTMNGVYYDEELGNNCFVQNASDEAFRLWKRLKS